MLSSSWRRSPDALVQFFVAISMQGVDQLQVSPLEFNSQVADVEFLQARVSFKYLIYTIEPGAGSCC